jgi:hypothetical protein
MRNGARALAEAARREATELVKLAADRRVGDTVKVAISRAASQLGWSYSRTEDIWRGEARRIDSWEMDLLRRVAARRGHRNPKPRR